LIDINGSMIIGIVESSSRGELMVWKCWAMVDNVHVMKLVWK